MDAKQFKKLLDGLGAWPEERGWAKGKSLAEVWATLDRADWMGWLLDKMAGKPGWPDASTVRLCACDCAETALKYTIDPRPAEAIRISRLYAIGKATDEELDAASNAAWAAASDAVWNTASAAAWAARAAYDAARISALDAVWNAAWSAASAAARTARDAAHREMCVLIRKRCGQFEALKIESGTR